MMISILIEQRTARYYLSKHIPGDREPTSGPATALGGCQIRGFHLTYEAGDWVCQSTSERLWPLLARVFQEQWHAGSAAFNP